MKKLICIKDIEHAHQAGETSIVVDDQTIITPAAKDLVDEYKMVFVHSPKEKIMPIDVANISKEDLVELLKKILQGTNQQPYDSYCHKSGLKIVKGQTVKPQPIVKDGKNINYQEIACLKDSLLVSGILEIENQCYSEDSLAESVNYIIAGEVEVSISGEKFTAAKGDTLFIPKNTKNTWSVRDKTTILVTKVKGVCHK